MSTKLPIRLVILANALLASTLASAQNLMDRMDPNLTPFQKEEVLFSRAKPMAIDQFPSSPSVMHCLDAYKNGRTELNDTSVIKVVGKVEIAPGSTISILTEIQVPAEHLPFKGTAVQVGAFFLNNGTQILQTSPEFIFAEKNDRKIKFVTARHLAGSYVFRTAVASGKDSPTEVSPTEIESYTYCWAN